MPPGKIISPAVIVSTLVATLTIISANIIIMAILKTQPFYTPFNPDNADYNQQNLETTSIFQFGNFQYLSTAVVFSLTMGRPFRRDIWWSWGFIINIVIFTAFNIMWMFNAGKVLMDFVLSVKLPMYWKGYMFGLAIVNFIVILILELLLVPPLTWLFNWIGTQ
jgi:hypothetical protein